MDLNQLISFVTVAQTLNFTSAAKRNGVPQSTVSRQIDSLEEQLGAQLFYRTRRQVRLTEEGRIFLPYARETLAQMEKGMEAVRRSHEGEEGRLSVAAVSAAGPFLTECLGDFARQCPNIAVDLRPASAGDGLPVANTDPVDFHFLPREMAEGQEEYELLTVCTDDLVLAAAREDPVIREGVSSETLQKERFLLISEKEDPILYMQAMDLCQSMRFTPAVAGCYDSVEALQIGVAAGLGVTILPARLAAEMEGGGLAVLPFPDGSRSMTYVAAWKKNLLNPSARLFLDILRQRAGSEE